MKVTVCGPTRHPCGPTRRRAQTVRPHTPTVRPRTAEREIVTGDNSPVAIGGSITQTINNPPKRRKARQ